MTYRYSFRARIVRGAVLLRANDAELGRFREAYVGPRSRMTWALFALAADLLVAALRAESN